MTNFMSRITIATLMVAAGAASAQTMKADIPFSFRAGTTVMAAGTYQVSSVNHAVGHSSFVIRNAESRNAILLSPLAGPDNKERDKGNPVLTFECGAGKCALVTIWSGFGYPAYRFPRLKLGTDEAAHIAVIAIPATKAD